MAKYISLTFDDGPCNASDDVMNRMLDILEKPSRVVALLLFC